MYNTGLNPHVTSFDDTGCTVPFIGVFGTDALPPLRTLCSSLDESVSRYCSVVHSRTFPAKSNILFTESLLNVPVG